MAYIEYAQKDNTPLGSQYTSEVTQILIADPETAVQKIASHYAPFQEPQEETRSSAYETAFEGLEGGAKVDKWQALVNSIQQTQELKLTSHAEGWEKKDSKHRVSELLVACHNIYKKQYPQADKAPDFYKWLDSLPELQRVMMIADEMRKLDAGVLQKKTPTWVKNNENLVLQSNLKPSIVKAFVKGVAYLDQVTRKSYRVKFDGGFAKRKNGAPFDTSTMKTVLSGPGFGIWVMSPQGKMYAGNHIYGQFHHSSFLAGTEVRAAGEIKAKNGKIEYLTAKSGHYMPPLSSLVWAVEALQHQSVDVGGMRVAVWKDKKVRLMSGTDFRRKSAGYESWGDLSPVDKEKIRRGEYDKFPSS